MKTTHCECQFDQADEPVLRCKYHADKEERIRALEAELARSRAANVYDAAAHARVSEIEAALREVLTAYESDDGVWPDGLHPRVRALTSETQSFPRRRR
jgi:hypothetical protein